MTTDIMTNMNDFDTPSRIISGALADLINSSLENNQLGVMIELTTELDPEWFLTRLADDANYNIGVVLAGLSLDSLADLKSATAETRVRVTDDVSDGVKWRNGDSNPFNWGGTQSPDRIVTLARGDPAKLGSLENLSPLSGAEIRTQIAQNVQEIPPFDSNVPGQQVWEAFESPVGSQFDIRSIAEYTHAVTNESGQAALEALGVCLNKLNLIPDEHLLDNSEAIADRLQENLDLVRRVSSMAGTDERRLSRSINKADSEEERRERATRVRKIRELHRGNRDILGELEFKQVDELMSTSLGGGGGSSATRRSTPSFGLESVFEGKDENLEKQAKSFTDDFREAVQNGDSNVSTSIGDGEEIYDKSVVDDDVYRFITHFIGAKSYGGVVTDAADLEDAIENFRSLKTNVYDIRGESSQFENLRRLADRQAEFKPLVDALDEFDKKRTNLTSYFDELYCAPLMNLLADPELRDLAGEYISVYERLEQRINEKYQTLNRKSGGGASPVLAEFLLLDTIAVRWETDEENYQIVLSPLHPLHLWKYVSLAQKVREQHQMFDEQDKEFLRSAVERQPHVLRSIDVGSNDHLPSAYLIQDRELANLPVYLPADRASVGTNATVWEHLTSKFLTAHPHARNRLRVTVVDPIQPGQLLDHLLQIAEDGGIRGCNVEFAYVDRERQSILRGSEDTEDIIETFGPDSGDEQYRVQVSEYASYDELIQEISLSPRHLILVNDHSMPSVREFERDKHVEVDPLYVPKIFRYDALNDRILMNSSPEGGLFSRHQDLVNNLNTRYNDVHKGSVHHLGFDSENVDDFLDVGVWVTLSAPSTNLDPFPQKNLIADEHRGDRDYAIYTNDREYFIRALTRLFNEYPLDVEEDQIAELVDSIVNYERSGLLRLVTEETEGRQFSRNSKGIIGAILAVKWLEREFQGPKLILSIDDPVTRKWLNLGSSSERADFLVVRFDDNDGVALEIVEVKALDDPDVEFSVDDSTSPPTVSGTAIQEQLLPTAQTIEEIFPEEDDVTTGPRREALKEQIFHELMASKVAESKEEWVDRINNTFGDGPNPNVTPNIVSVEITNGADAVSYFTALSADTSQDVDIVRLPRQILYELITGDMPDITSEESSETDEGELDTETDERELDTESGDKETVDTDSSNLDVETDDGEGSSNVTSSESSNGSVENHGKTITTFGDPCDYIDQVDQLKLVLGDFGISVRDIDADEVEVGPNIIRYKIKLGPSEKEASLRSRTEDIARQMAFEREPIVQRLPGTKYLGLDVPRPKRAVVRLSEYEQQFTYPNKIESLPFLAGITPDGSLHREDISKAPHMLIAGSTGSGKTVFLYSLIASLLQQKEPDEFDLALIDPKETDFLYFDSLPNLVNDGVIGDAREAEEFFQWVVDEEIPRRKQLLKEKITRDIGEYNDLLDADEEPLRPLVIIIDEYADLLQQLGNDADMTENNVRRIAQIARSLGIHLVVATQRPSHNAIDTDLRANLDMRIAFRLPKQSDSRIILNESGAEELGGDGDMLLKEADGITRLQGLYVDSDYIRELITQYR